MFGVLVCILKLGFSVHWQMNCWMLLVLCCPSRSQALLRFCGFGLLRRFADNVNVLIFHVTSGSALGRI